jgi:hypothetical protein
MAKLAELLERWDSPDPANFSDIRRLDRAIAALTSARHAAFAGMFFASEEGLVAVEACRRLFQTDCLETIYGEIWLEAGTPPSDDVDEWVRALDAPVLASKQARAA